MSPGVIRANLVVSLKSFYREKSAVFFTIAFPIILILVFGTIFAVTGRIWMVMCAHAAFDLTAVAIIYWNLEAAVAHLVFK